MFQVAILTSTDHMRVIMTRIRSHSCQRYQPMLAMLRVLETSVDEYISPYFTTPHELCDKSKADGLDDQAINTRFLGPSGKQKIA
jgi:hypothetical protein